MKKDELTIEDSPFYVEYKEKSVDKSFKMPKDMLKALENHLQEKYQDEIKKDIGNKFRFGKYIRKTLEDYLQHQCLERKMFGKSIFAIVSEDALKKESDPLIDALFVTNPSIYYQTRKFDELSLLYYQVHKVPIEDFNHELMDWGAYLENKFLKRLKDYQDSYSSKDIHVLEIQLNNYLDWNHDGIYSDRSDSDVHIGANIIPTTDGAFGLFYHWKVLNDYSIEIFYIQACSQELLIHMLRQCGNKKMYTLYLSYFKNHNQHFPKLEIDILKAQLERKENIKSDLQDEIDDLKNQIQKLKDL